EEHHAVLSRLAVLVWTEEIQLMLDTLQLSAFQLYLRPTGTPCRPCSQVIAQGPGASEGFPHDLLANSSHIRHSRCQAGRFTALVESNGEVHVQILDLENGYLLWLVTLHSFIDVVEDVEHVNEAVTAYSSIATECLHQMVSK